MSSPNVSNKINLDSNIDTAALARGEWGNVRLKKSSDGRVSLDVINHKTCEKIRHTVISFFKSALEKFNIVLPTYSYGDDAKKRI